jgi:hypothetical protein
MKEGADGMACRLIADPVVIKDEAMFLELRLDYHTDAAHTPVVSFPPVGVAPLAMVAYFNRVSWLHRRGYDDANELWRDFVSYVCEVIDAVTTGPAGPAPAAAPPHRRDRRGKRLQDRVSDSATAPIPGSPTS